MSGYELLTIMGKGARTRCAAPPAPPGTALIGTRAALAVERDPRGVVDAGVARRFAQAAG